MALITTPAAVDADSYASLAEAESYLTGSPYASGWNVAAASAKEWAMRMSARSLDTLAWTGAAATAEQALCWPRLNMLNKNGFVIASGEIPIQLKQAQIEWAKQMITTDPTASNSVVAQGITSVKAGPVELEFKESDVAYAALRQEEAIAAAVPDIVRALLVPSWLTDPREQDAAYVGLVFESM